MDELNTEECCSGCFKVNATGSIVGNEKGQAEGKESGEAAGGWREAGLETHSCDVSAQTEENPRPALKTT